MPAHFPRMLLLFVVIFAALQISYHLSQDSLLETLIIDQATVQASAFLLNLIQDTAQVQGIEHRLVSDQVRLSVLNGCEGTEMLFMVIAAILAFRSSWQQKAIAMTVGVALVYGLNQVRIIALFLSLLHQPDWFGAIHGLVGPTVMVLCLALAFHGWVNHIQPAQTPR